jgi:predicted permease
MPTLLRDVRSGFRALRAAPSTTAAAVLVIALGVGANTAVLAVTYGILIRPLPYRDVPRLAILSVATPDGSDFGVPLDQVEEWQRRLRTVEALAGYSTGELRLEGAGEPRLVEAASVTDTFFDVLGVGPARGRLGSEAVVLSNRLAAHLEAPESGLIVGDCACTVGAVLPRDFSFPSDGVDVWAAARPLPEGARDSRSFRMVARARPGVSWEQVEEDAARVLREIHGLTAPAPGSASPRVTPLEDALVGDLRPVLGASMAGAVLVLLVTCGNVAMLLLGRTILRRRDSAVRLALGAGGWRLAQGSLIESFLLASIGSLLGLGLAALAVRIFLQTAGGMIPRAQAVAIDAPVLAASAATVFLVALLCGAAPALYAARKDFTGALRGGGAGEPRVRRALALLVVGQIAVSIVLLTSAALLARTVERLLAEDSGFEPDRVLVVKLPLGTRTGAVEGSAFVRDMLDRVRAEPGVLQAGIGSSLPPAGLPFQIYVRVLSGARDEGRSLSVVSATPGFLEALGARVSGGRAFLGADDRAEPSVVLLSESAARFASGEDLVDRELPMRLPPIATFAGRPRVIGVVGDMKYAGLDQPADATVYLPWSARPAETAYLAVRTAGDPLATAPAVRRILRELDPGLPVPQIRSLADEMALSIAGRRLRVVPALGFAGVALGVALTGIFALLSRAAAERRRELAIRIALGASRSRILGLMLGMAGALTCAGLGAGLAGTVVVTRGLRSLLFGVGPHDPLTFVAVALFVAAASLLAAWLPARRAAKVEPLALLRPE